MGPSPIAEVLPFEDPAANETPMLDAAPWPLQERADRAGRDETDDELVRRARLGDKQAFATLVERHGPAMYRFGLRLLGDAPTTEDCVQDTFLAAWQSLDRFRGEATVKTWLFSILVHQARRQIRTRTRHPATAQVPDDLPAPAGVAPLAQVEAADLLHALEAALADLPPMLRACWILREVEGMSYEEIADIQTTSVSTVRGALHRARQELGRRLQPWR